MNEKKSWQLFMLLGTLLIVALLFPFFSGQTLNPADSIKSMPMSKFGFDQLVEKGRIVQWIPFLFGGMPCYSSVMVTPSYLVSVVFTWILGPVLPLFKDPVMQHILHLLLMGAGAALYLRRRGIGWTATAFAAFSLMLATTNTGLMGAGHTIKLWTICWMPLNLYWLDRLLEERRISLLPAAAFSLGMMLTVKHIQMSWYFLLFAGLYTLLRLLLDLRDTTAKERVRSGSLALGWVVTGLLLAAFLYLPVLDYSGMSMRALAGESAATGAPYAAAYSYPPGDLLTWLLPQAKGFGGGDYFGQLEYTAFPLYAGALWLPLVIFALVRSESRRQLLALLLPGLFLLLIGFAANSPLFELFQRLLPGFAKFRAHMWAIALSQMSLLLAAAFGLDLLIRTIRGGQKEKLSKYVLYSAGGAFLLALLMALAAPAADKPLPAGDSFSHEMDARRAQYMLYQQGVQPTPGIINQVLGQFRAKRANAFYMDAARLFALLGAGSLLVWLYGLGRIKELALMSLIALLLAADLIPVDRRTMNFENRRNAAAWFRPQGALAELARLPEKHEFRVWPQGVYAHNELSWHGLHSIEGYHGAKPAGIQRVLTEGMVRLNGAKGPVESLHPNWLDLLNVQYILGRQALPGYEVLSAQRDGILMQNPTALPRLSFPGEIRSLPGDDHFDAIMSADFDPSTTMLVDSEQVEALPARQAESSGRIVAYDEEGLTLEIETAGPSVALLSEIWLPRGWVARLNGAEVPIIRANHLLRAVHLPEAGKWKLEMEYRPFAWRAGVLISLLAAALLILMFILNRNYKQKMNHQSGSRDLK